jgi:hypothetical protein
MIERPRGAATIWDSASVAASGTRRLARPRRGWKSVSTSLPRALEPEIRDRLIAALKAIGYAHVTIDLQGYRMGSLNEGLRLRQV